MQFAALEIRLVKLCKSLNGAFRNRKFDKSNAERNSLATFAKGNFNVVNLAIFAKQTLKFFLGDLVRKVHNEEPFVISYFVLSFLQNLFAVRLFTRGLLLIGLLGFLLFRCLFLQRLGHEIDKSVIPALFLVAVLQVKTEELTELPFLLLNFFALHLALLLSLSLGVFDGRIFALKST